MAGISRRFSWTPTDDTPEGMFAIPLPFDPRSVFGKARARVVVTIGAHSYRSTVAHMGGPPFVPLRESNRTAAGVKAGQPVEIELTLDTEIRTVDVPDDLAAALALIPGARDAWDRASFTHRREYVDAISGAKKPETRQRRLDKAVAFIRARVKND